MSNYELTYKLNGDASGIVEAAAKAKRALEDLQGSGGKGGGKGGSNAGGTVNPDTVRKATAALDQHGQSIAKLGERYKTLDKAKEFFNNQPAQLKKIEQSQLNVAKSGMAMANSAQEYAKFAELAAKHQEKIDQLSKKSNGNGPFSPHSQRQFGQIAGIGMAVGGQVLGQLGAAGRQLYQAGTSTYNQIASQYTINPALLDSQRALKTAQFGMGSQLSGYETFKNNAQASIMSSKAAVPLAVAGDVLGTVGSSVGSAMQLAGAAKAAGMSTQALQTVGKAGLLAAAPIAGAGVGLLLGSAIKGEKPEDVVEKNLNPTQLGHRKAQELIRSNEFKSDVAKMSPQELKADAQALDEEAQAIEKYQKVMKSGNIDERQKAFDKMRSTYKKYGKEKEFDWNVKNGTWQDENLVESAKVATSDIARAKGGKGVGDKTIMQEIMETPEFKVQQARQINAVKDFAQDTQREEAQVKRGYARQQEDTGRSRTRAGEDYAITQSRLNIQQSRLGEDTARQTGRLGEDTSKQRSRLEQDTYKERTRAITDFNKTRLRLDQDYARQNESIQLSIFRTQRDYTTQSTRLAEDTARQRGRILQDSGRNLARLEEDSSRSLTRLEEDTDRQRIRSFEDYTTQKQQLSRQSSRSEQDLNTGLQDSLVSMFAPGVASNKGYQLAKLMRDYNKQKGRLKEDTATQNQQIERGYSRSQEDIARGESRGKEDIGRELSRGREDIARETNRALTDLSVEATRAAADALKGLNDAMKDASIAQRDATTSYQRSLEDSGTSLKRTMEDVNTSLTRGMADIQTSFSRGMQDINTSYARGMQDIQMSQQEAALNYKRTLEDLDTASKRAAEDFATNMEQIGIARERFIRDQGLLIEEQKTQYKDLVMSSVELNNAFKNVVEIINNLPKTPEGGNGNKKVPGAALGMNVVPNDEFLVRTHKNEMIMDAQTAQQYRALGGTANKLPPGVSKNQQYQQDVASLSPIMGQGLAEAMTRQRFELGQLKAQGSGLSFNGKSFGGPGINPPGGNKQLTFNQTVNVGPSDNSVKNRVEQQGRKAAEGFNRMFMSMGW